MMKNAAVRRFFKRKASVVGLVLLVIFFGMALFGPLLCPLDPLEQDVKSTHQGPSKEHWFGTDYLGRDTFTRIVYGARTSLLLSFSGVLAGSLIGIILGLVAGYYGKTVDAVISRIIDILLAFPGLLLAMTIVAILGNGLVNTGIAIAVFSIPSMARMIRAETINLRNQQYVSATRVMGGSNFRIIATHVLPNAISQIIVNITLGLGAAILTASSLSFLGLGVQPPYPEWGAMLNKAKDALRLNPAEAIFPGLVITLVVISFSLVGDGLRDALDPKLKNVS